MNDKKIMSTVAKRFTLQIKLKVLRIIYYISCDFSTLAEARNSDRFGGQRPSQKGRSIAVRLISFT